MLKTKMRAKKQRLLKEIAEMVIYLAGGRKPRWFKPKNKKAIAQAKRFRAANMKNFP